MFACFESHQPFLGFKEKTISRGMRSSARGPRRDTVCASCRTSDPTTIRGLNQTSLRKIGQAVIVFNGGIQDLPKYKRVWVHRGCAGCWSEKQSHPGTGDCGPYPAASHHPPLAPQGAGWEGYTDEGETGQGIMVRMFEN